MGYLLLWLACGGSKTDISDDGITAQEGDSGNTNDSDSSPSDSGSDTENDSDTDTDSPLDSGDTAVGEPSYPFYWAGEISVDSNGCTATVSEVGVEFTQDPNGIQLLQDKPCPECDEIYYIEEVDPLEACGLQFTKPIIRGISREADRIRIYRLDSLDGFVFLAEATAEGDGWRYEFEVDGTRVSARVSYSWD